MAIALANSRDGEGRLSMASLEGVASRSHRKRGTARPTFCECGNHAFANLTKGFVALVSPEDADQFRYYWNATLSKDGYVMVARSKSLGHQKHKTVVLAREILGLTGKDLADHASRNTLDNRRTNIRPCSKSQNAQNSKVPCDSRTGAKGVHFHGRRYYSVITKDGVRHRLGGFPTLEAAKAAYDQKAAELFGDFARSA